LAGDEVDISKSDDIGTIILKRSGRHGMILGMIERHNTDNNCTSASTISATTTKPARKDQPARRGKRWTKAEEMDMIALFMNGNTSQKIAAWLQRTPLAIIMRTFKVMPDFLNKPDAAHDAEKKELNDQVESWKSVAKHLLRELDEKTTPMIGNSA
jgi:hypothetical protein